MRQFQTAVSSWRGFLPRWWSWGMAGLFQRPSHLRIHLFSLNAFQLVLASILGIDSTNSLVSLWFGAGPTAIPQGLWAVTIKSLRLWFLLRPLLWSPLLVMVNSSEFYVQAGSGVFIVFHLCLVALTIYITGYIIAVDCLNIWKMLEWRKGAPWCCQWRYLLKLV